MAYPLSLSGLSEREEITDTVVRALLGLDSNDKFLWESAWALDSDIILDINGNVLKGLENINKGCFDKVGPMNTQHLLSNIRIDLEEGANVARLTAYVLAQHYRPGEGVAPNSEHLLAGATYDIQVVKESNGKWNLKAFALKIIWRQGNPEVMESA